MLSKSLTEQKALALDEIDRELNNEKTSKKKRVSKKAQELILQKEKERQEFLDLLNQGLENIINQLIVMSDSAPYRAMELADGQLEGIRTHRQARDEMLQAMKGGLQKRLDFAEQFKGARVSWAPKMKQLLHIFELITRDLLVLHSDEADFWEKALDESEASGGQFNALVLRNGLYTSDFEIGSIEALRYIK